MNFQRPVTATITIGDQPTVADLEKLKQEGYVGVVNLRNDGEPDQPLSTSEEGNQVRALGMKYLHYGVGAAPLSEAGVTAVCDFVDETPKGTDKVWSTVDEGRARSPSYSSSKRAPITGAPRKSSRRERHWDWKSTAGSRCWSRCYLSSSKR